MARRSQEAIDYLRAIETLSETEEPLSRAVKGAGPGGEAYDRTPTSGSRQERRGKLVNFGQRTREIVSSIAAKFSEPNHVSQKTSRYSERFQRRAATFLKENAAIIGGVAVFGASLFAARKYWHGRRGR